MMQRFQAGKQMLWGWCCILYSKSVIRKLGVFFSIIVTDATNGHEPLSVAVPQLRSLKASTINLVCNIANQWEKAHGK